MGSTMPEEQIYFTLYCLSVLLKPHLKLAKLMKQDIKMPPEVAI